MVQPESKLVVADNTGAKVVKVIRRIQQDRKTEVSLGEIFVGSVQSSSPEALAQCKKGKVVYCVVVRVKKEVRRQDGSYIRFSENACVILTDNKKDPRGTRVFGPVARELRDNSFLKIISLAPEVL